MLLNFNIQDINRFVRRLTKSTYQHHGAGKLIVRIANILMV